MVLYIYVLCKSGRESTQARNGLFNTEGDKYYLVTRFKLDLFINELT